MLLRIIAVVLSVVGATISLAQAQDKPEIFPQLGHSFSVDSVAFSPDGKLLVSGGDDGTTKLWDMASGRELRTFTGHSDAVYSVAFSPDGRIVASASRDKTIKLWDVASGRELRTLRSQSDIFVLVGFSPDGRILAATGRGAWLHPPNSSIYLSNSSIYLWDIASGRELKRIQDGDGFEFSPDGSILALSKPNDHTIELWDVARWRRLRTLRGHSDAVSSVAFSPDGHLLASGSDDKSIKLWDVASGRELSTLSGHSAGVLSIAFSPDGRLLASSSYDKSVRLWDVASGRELKTFHSSVDSVESVAFSPDGRMLAASTNPIELLDVASGRELRALGGNAAQMLLAVAFAPDGRILASGGRDKTIRLWDAADGHQLRTLRGHSGRINAVSFSPDGRLLVSASDDSSIKLWDVASGRELKTFHDSVGVESVAFSPDGSMLASGSSHRSIKLWDVASGLELRTLSDFNSSDSDDVDSDDVTSVAFSPNGRILAAGDFDHHAIELWDVATGRKLRTLVGHTFVVSSIAFSPDGRTLASASWDYTVKLWDVASGGELRTLKHSSGVNSVAFSPDGRTLASCSDMVTLWDVESGRKLRSFARYAGVWSVAYSPNGKWLATSGEHGTVKIWQASTGDQQVSLIDFADGSYIAITPEGYYDASSRSAEDNLNVRIGNRVFSIAAYRDRFYRPDLVRLSLAGNSLIKLGYAGIDNVKLAPIVTLVGVPSSANEPKLTVHLRITDSGGGIGLVRLFVNGTAVVQDDAPHPSTPGSTISQSYTVQLASGANALRVVAFNADDSMQSNSAVADIELPVARYASLHAVIVGIQDFKNPNLNLQYSVADARLFAATLEKYAAPLFKGKPDIRLLITPADTTRERLIQTMKSMEQSVGPNDLFVFYVASHGLTDSGDYYLITSNVGSLSTDRLKTDAITKEELTALISNIAATKKLMVIDTCEAEALGTALEASLLTRGLDEATALKILSRAVGTTVLAASTSTQEALEGYRGHGLFTYVVAQGLGGKGDVDKDGYVTTLGLAHYVDDRVPDLAEQQFKRAQYPTVETNGQEFPLAKVN